MISMLLDLIPKSLYALIVVALLAFVAVTQVSLSKEKTAHAETKVKLSTAVAEAAVARANAERVNREKETEVNKLNAKLVEKTNEHLKDKAVAVARANAKSSSLLNAAQEVARKASEKCTGSSTSSDLKTGGGSCVVLADVLGRVNQRAVELAAVADEARIRGQACEAQYDSLEKVFNQEGTR
jgi:hypothetical protein